MRHKLIILFFGVLLYQGCKKDIDSNKQFVDKRDNESYKIIDIGNQTWMAENLRYRGGELKPGKGLDSISNDASPLHYYIYKDSKKYYKRFGSLYTWTAAQIACPDGWHLPTDNEWQEMEISLGMTNKEAEGSNWRGTNEGSQLKKNGTSGFNGLMSGYKSNRGGFRKEKEVTAFWTSTPILKNTAYHRTLYESETKIHRGDAKNGDGFCVRCVKDK